MSILKISLVPLLLIVITLIATALLRPSIHTPEVFPVDLTDVTPDRYLEYNYQNFANQDKVQIDCLAANMYHEAKNQGYYGMKAVGLVTMNRVSHTKFPNEVCNVVHQKKGKVCQFSWYCSKVKLNKSSKEYKIARDIAVRLYAQRALVLDFTEGALFFHADYVSPYWSKILPKTTQIGRHIFYTL
jgi:spore germination cell wall hydrolase CwlJ-like protein